MHRSGTRRCSRRLTVRALRLGTDELLDVATVDRNLQRRVGVELGEAAALAHARRQRPFRRRLVVAEPALARERDGDAHVLRRVLAVMIRHRRDPEDPVELALWTDVGLA